MDTESIRGIILIVGLGVQGGILYAGFKQTRGDLNGLGRKVRGMEERGRSEFLVLAIASLMGEVAEEKLPRFVAKANWFIEASRRNSN